MMIEEFFISNVYVRSQTLTARLGDILRQIEALYGQRDRDFTILGVEFHPSVSCLYFPSDSNTKVMPECKQVIISIDSSCQNDPLRVYGSLAHECIHLLSPRVGQASFLEEGLAVSFSLSYMQRFTGHRMTSVGHPLYDQAMVLFERAEFIYPDLIRRVRGLHQGRLSDLVVEWMREALPSLPEDLLSSLTEEFPSQFSVQPLEISQHSNPTFMERQTI